MVDNEGNLVFHMAEDSVLQRCLQYPAEDEETYPDLVVGGQFGLINMFPVKFAVEVGLEPDGLDKDVRLLCLGLSDGGRAERWFFDNLFKQPFNPLKDTNDDSPSACFDCYSSNYYPLWEIERLLDRTVEYINQITNNYPGAERGQRHYIDATEPLFTIRMVLILEEMLREAREHGLDCICFKGP